MKHALPIPVSILPSCLPHAQDEFIFRVESTGALTAESIVRHAIEIVVEKINALSVAVREIQSREG